MKHPFALNLFCIFTTLLWISVARAEKTNDLSSVARLLLDASKPAAERETFLNANADRSAQLIIELTKQIKVGTDDEYRGIPSIWQVAVAAGKRNSEAEIREILAVSLPQPDEPLLDWQAVVIGGGIINGLSLEGIWPRERIENSLRGDAPLKRRWLRSIELASVMADDEKVRHGTRYDALRMLGVAPWKKHGGQLTKYLGKNVNGELQQGAVSGLADVDSNEAAQALIENFDNFTNGNRQFALDALIRNEARRAQLLDGIAEEKIKLSLLGAERLQKLKDSPDKKTRQRLAQLEKRFAPPN